MGLRHPDFSPWYWSSTLDRVRLGHLSLQIVPHPTAVQQVRAYSLEVGWVSCREMGGMGPEAETGYVTPRESGTVPVIAWVFKYLPEASVLKN